MGRVIIYPEQARAAALKASTPKRVEIAHEIVGIAQPQAKVLTGSYKASYAVEVSGDKVSAVNNEPDASYIVFGTEDTPPHDELLDAARQFGRYSGWTVRG